MVENRSDSMNGMTGLHDKPSPWAACCCLKYTGTNSPGGVRLTLTVLAFSVTAGKDGAAKMIQLND